MRALIDPSREIRTYGEGTVQRQIRPGYAQDGQKVVAEADAPAAPMVVQEIESALYVVPKGLPLGGGQGEMLQEPAVALLGGCAGRSRASTKKVALQVIQSDIRIVKSSSGTVGEFQVMRCGENIGRIVRISRWKPIGNVRVGKHGGAGGKRSFETGIDAEVIRRNKCFRPCFVVRAVSKQRSETKIGGKRKSVVNPPEVEPRGDGGIDELRRIRTDVRTGETTSAHVIVPDTVPPAVGRDAGGSRRGGDVRESRGASVSGKEVRIRHDHPPQGPNFHVVGSIDTRSVVWNEKRRAGGGVAHPRERLFRSDTEKQLHIDREKFLRSCGSHHVKRPSHAGRVETHVGSADDPSGVGD